MGLFSSSQKIIDLEAERDAFKAAIEGTGLYTASKSDTGALVLTPTEKGTAALAQTDSAALLLTAQTDLSAAQAENLELARQYQASTAQVEAFKAAFPANGHFTFGADAAKPVVALTDAGKVALINSGITTTLAATGHGALPIAGVDTGKGATADADAKLTPKERLAASTKANLADRKIA